MYAVTFDIDTNCLGDQYHNNSSSNAYGDIRKFMESNNFAWQQGSVVSQKNQHISFSFIRQIFTEKSN